MKKEKNNLNQEIVWLINEKYGGRMTERAKKDINRLEKGEPVDYVIGYKKFCGCKIDLRYKPLIPREETENWAQSNCLPCAGVLGERPREPLKNAPDTNNRFSTNGKMLKVLDMFAGSGCCGIAVLKNVANSHCDFVDVDDNCLKQIRFNLRLNGIDKKRHRIIKSNMFSKLSVSGTDNGLSVPDTDKPGTDNKYDLILANPPYIGFEQENKVQKSVLNFEPKKALFAKNNGLYFIEKFLKQAKNYLRLEGVIYLEFGYNQKKDIAKLLKNFEYKNFEFGKDQFGKWRFVRIKN